MNCQVSATTPNPRQLHSFLNASLAKDFVNISAICYLDLQNSKEISFLFTNSLIK
jgi:hypothetical protein